jgi:hypothetical protein
MHNRRDPDPEPHPTNFSPGQVIQIPKTSIPLNTRTSRPPSRRGGGPKMERSGTTPQPTQRTEAAPLRPPPPGTSCNPLPIPPRPCWYGPRVRRNTEGSPYPPTADAADSPRTLLPARSARAEPYRGPPRRRWFTGPTPRSPPSAAVSPLCRVHAAAVITRIHHPRALTAPPAPARPPHPPPRRQIGRSAPPPSVRCSIRPATGIPYGAPGFSAGRPGLWGPLRRPFPFPPQQARLPREPPQLTPLHTQGFPSLRPGTSRPPGAALQRSVSPSRTVLTRPSHWLVPRASPVRRTTRLPRPPQPVVPPPHPPHTPLFSRLPTPMARYLPRTPAPTPARAYHTSGPTLPQPCYLQLDSRFRPDGPRTSLRP